MNAKIKIASIALVLILLVLSACAANPTPSGSPTGTPEAEIANPATANCELKGYRSQIRITEDGSQYGVCIFPDGSACEEWAFYRGECLPVPENTTTGTDTQIANPASVNCLQTGGRLDIRTTANGSQYGVCIFSDGSECEEWAYLRSECAPASQKPTIGTDSSQIANPASAYCEEKDGKADIRTAADGSQGGVCVFPDGSECEEWAFYRGECTPGSYIPSK